MDRRSELIFLGITLLGLLVSQSPLVVIPPLTLGIMGTLVFVFGLGGIFFDDIKGFLDITAQ